MRGSARGRGRGGFDQEMRDFERPNQEAEEARTSSSVGSKNVPRFGKNDPMGKRQQYDQLIADVNKHREKTEKERYENDALARDIEREQKRQKCVGEFRIDDLSPERRRRFRSRSPERSRDRERSRDYRRSPRRSPDRYESRG